jgi:hypothetical protein
MAGIPDYSTTPSSNASVGSVNFSEGQAPSSVNDSARALMADIAAAHQVETASGTDTYTITLDVTPTAYSNKMDVWVLFTNANTGAATLNVNSLGAKSIVKGASSALEAGDIIAGSTHHLKYDGTNFVLSDPRAFGVQTVWSPAASMLPRTTTGCAAATQVESATNKINLAVLDFDAATDEFAQFAIRMPKSWNEGTVTAAFSWLATNTGNVVWGIQGVAVSDDDVLDAAFGTAQTVTDGVTATTDLMISAATSAVTIAGTPAAEDLVVFQVYRDADNGSDTCAVDARLVGVTLYITCSKPTDD